MVPAFHVSYSEMLGKCEKLVSSRGACELDVWPHLQALTSDVISRTAFGSNYEEGIRIFELITEQSLLVMDTVQSLYIPGTRFLPTKRNRRMKEIDKEVNTSIRSIIDNRHKEIKAGEGNNHDLLGIMLESNIKDVEKHQNKSHGMTINEVIDEHHEWQARAREEILSVLGDNDIDIDGLNHLKVVNIIFYEVLRLYPPVVGTARMNFGVWMPRSLIPTDSLRESLRQPKTKSFTFRLVGDLKSALDRTLHCEKQKLHSQ
ncbi:hypothetical protein L1987_74644 [Smallanthus sonchifolius]|uniref:Uncharacterized protein n=1 Tax=Smallanthus sonchifolius TaxID=185202 RepID=A0ACB9A458_9ASTR|nr:hypothetical protein L1987_74644 [Smallanthus sonchifolius]